MTVTESRVQLTDLADDAFISIVNQDVRGSLNPEISQLLRDPAIADRWYDALLGLKRSVESQLSASKAEKSQKIAEFNILGNDGWLQARVQTDKWRAGAVRFKNGVEDRLSEAKRFREEAHKTLDITVVVAERDNALREVRRLRSGIIKHRDHECDSSCDDNCIGDEELWSLLDSVSS